MEMSNYYEVLNCNEDSSYEDIKTNYHALIRKLHPDKNNCQNTEEFLKVNEAWNVISDPNKKQLYDEQLLKSCKPQFSTKKLLTELFYNEQDEIYFYQCRCGGEITIPQYEVNEFISANYKSVQLSCFECSMNYFIVLEN